MSSLQSVIEYEYNNSKNISNPIANTYQIHGNNYHQTNPYDSKSSKFNQQILQSSNPYSVSTMDYTGELSQNLISVFEKEVQKLKKELNDINIKSNGDIKSTNQFNFKEEKKS